MRLSSSLQFPVFSTIPVSATSIRTILSFIRIIRAVAHFYGNFFVHFFCLELFRVNFFSASLPATSTCSSIRYTSRSDSFFSFCPFFVRLCSIRSLVRAKKKGFRVSFKYKLYVSYKKKKEKKCGLSYFETKWQFYIYTFAKLREWWHLSIN